MLAHSLNEMLGCNILLKDVSTYFYEGDAVNRSQMDIKYKTHDIRTWKRLLFLDISSINIDTLVLSLNSASKPAA
jgi:hypothetical protein